MRGRTKTNGVWNIRYRSDLNFGRAPFEPLVTFKRKFQYCVAALYRQDEDKVEELKRIAVDVITGLKDIKFPIDYGWREEDEPYTYYGDAEDYGKLQKFLETYNITLRDFLTDSRYVIFVDGDEYEITKKLMGSGLMPEENFELLYD